MPFKVGAYRRAADSILHSPVDVVAAYRAGPPPRLSGVGKAIDEKLAELADTGRLRFYERLRRDVPPSLVSLLAVPGLGPRTAGDLWRALGISTLPELEVAARDGRLRSGPRHEREDREKILDGLAELRKRPPTRMRLGEADGGHRRGSSAVLLAAPGVRVGGRLRARCGGAARPSATSTSWSRRTSPRRSSPTSTTSRVVDRVGGHGGRLGAQRTTVQLRPRARSST